MGFYGDLYTNLTTFFHNFKITSNNTTRFPQTTTEDMAVIASPKTVYDTFGITSGNRWIQFIPKPSVLKNPDGSDNYDSITIYHAAPELANADDDIINEIGLEKIVDPNISDTAISLASGGYLKVQTSVYDSAGHLKRAEDKYFALPNINTISSIVNTALTSSNEAKEKATSALNTAELATDNANIAAANANTALEMAQTASNNAINAESTANESIGIAAQAERSASNAVASINDLRGDNTTTISDINNQLSTLNSYKEVSNANMEQIKDILTEMLSLIQTGKTDWSNEELDNNIEIISANIDKINIDQSI